MVVMVLLIFLMKDIVYMEARGCVGGLHLGFVVVEAQILGGGQQLRSALEDSFHDPFLLQPEVHAQ